MDFVPGSSVTLEFCTQRFDTGASANADSTPAGTVNKNGTDDGAVTVTVTNIDTGRYKATFTIPLTYTGGDVLNVSVAATVNSVSGKAITWGPYRISHGRQATAQAGAASTITLDASASATDNLYRGYEIVLISGTGAGQFATISAYNGTTKVATIQRLGDTSGWTTNPDNTTVFQIRSVHQSNVGLWRGSSPNALQSGRVDAYGGAMATDVLNAAALAADAVTEIQSGLSTLTAAGVRSAVGLTSANLDTQLAAIAAYIDTEVAAIKAKTDGLPSDPADASDIAASFASIASTLSAITAALLDAAAVRSALGMAAADLDDQLDAINSKTTNLPGSPAAVGSAMTLADAAITSAKFSVSAEAAGIPTGFLERLQRFMNKFSGKRYRVKATGATTLYSGSTPLETQSLTDDGTTEKQEAATAP